MLSNFGLKCLFTYFVFQAPKYCEFLWSKDRAQHWLWFTEDPVTYHTWYLPAQGLLYTTAKSISKRVGKRYSEIQEYMVPAPTNSHTAVFAAATVFSCPQNLLPHLCLADTCHLYYRKVNSTQYWLLVPQQHSRAIYKCLTNAAPALTSLFHVYSYIFALLFSVYSSMPVLHCSCCLHSGRQNILHVSARSAISRSHPTAIPCSLILTWQKNFLYL